MLQNSYAMRSRTLLLLVLVGIHSVFSQELGKMPREYRHSISSTLFVLANLVPYDDPPNYYQLNYLYRIDRKSFVSIEAITWTYGGPLGRPYGPNYENIESNFPGSVKAYGAGLAYKRFLWRKFYGAVHSTALKQDYRDPEKKRIQSGFQLFNSLRLGYHITLFNGRIFMEPSVATTFWPINTNLPGSFQTEEDKWNNFFLFEPGLHVGVNF